MPQLEGAEKVPPMPPLESDYKVKERNRLKILTLNKLSTRLPVLLSHIKTGNNSYKLKRNETYSVSTLSTQ